MSAADDAFAKAKAIAARLSGSALPAAPVAADVANVAQAAVAAALGDGNAGATTNPPSETTAERKRKRWGKADDSAATSAPPQSNDILPGLQEAEKRLKTAAEPIQKRVWVDIGQKPPNHFVRFLKGPDGTKPQEIIAQLGGGDDLKITIKGRGSTNAPPPPGMPEEPLHVLIEGPPDMVFKAEGMIDDLLREAENSPVSPDTEDAAAPPAAADDNAAQNQQLAESIANKAADALAAAMGGAGGGTAAPAAGAAGYKPAPVAQLIGQALSPATNAPSSTAGHYGPGEMLEEQIGVPNGVVGFIIGRGGESISSMQARSGCRVQIQKEHEMAPGQTQRVITLTASSKESIDICRGIIESMVQDRLRSQGGGGSMGAVGGGGGMGTGAASQAAKLQEAIASGHVLVKVQVPDADVGLIIGKAGANIKNIQDRSGANVQIPPQADPDNPQVRTVSVTHPHADGANLAKQLIEDLLNSKPSNQGAIDNITLQVAIPDKDVGMCIGRQGCVIREMQNKTGTRIQIPSQPTPGQAHRIATVTGTAAGCAQVQQMIERIIQEQTSQTVMAGTAYTHGAHGQQQQAYGQQQYGAYGQQQAYGGAYGQHQQQQAAGGQQDYSAEWAAYYAAQAAATNGASSAAAGSTAAAATPAPAPANGGSSSTQQPAADAYYDQFFRYAYHYGEDAARKYYGAWSPPAGTPNPYGSASSAAASGGAPAPAAEPSQAPPTTGTTTNAAETAAAMGARDTSVRAVSNLPAWMTKGTS